MYKGLKKSHAYSYTHVVIQNKQVFRTFKIKGQMYFTTFYVARKFSNCNNHKIFITWRTKLAELSRGLQNLLE